MSVAFSSARPRSKGEVTQQTIQKMLDENHHLIQCIMDYQSKGKTAECTQYQQILHRNLVYLATIADSNQNMQSLLPAPPTPNMGNIGAGGMGQSGGSGPLHSQSNLNDTMTPGLPPTSMMQSQMSNVSMMHQQSATPHYPSSQTGGGQQQYQGQQAAMGMLGQSGQGNNMMSQRPMGTYRPTQQGSAPQYMGQDDFYGEQYGHTQSSSEPINQQYYSDGHGEYSYQQSSYGEQGYERSFDESSQHYYEGGNSQYSQQQAQYQQGSGQQQPFSQQQYPSQQGYSGQPQGYGPGQGAPSQYSQYQQGQGQQYSSYRSSQAASGAQTQRPYAYEQVQLQLPPTPRFEEDCAVQQNIGVNTETTSNKAPPPGQTGGQVRQGNSSVNNPQQSCVNQSLSK
ncbi:calcium-responsive transactivator isoform X6 [Salmo salar]|uniref:Calcium-responsive transactivator isoform X6 n=1 Tax=Salmo salar TaxID=8030 RepID=A0A1S3MD43_SALSA|nr:calcium-responsive transactivator isoform X6 [Salmo salar]XP_029575760.1 calcium-responsive transactivator-like isoform X5 [Salmo trutta]|eukprot:XP_014000964.1 PREDICTED: calcium-responsive transactivator-like isoform X5 [Salmo salar]